MTSTTTSTPRHHGLGSALLVAGLVVAGAALLPQAAHAATPVPGSRGPLSTAAGHLFAARARTTRAAALGVRRTEWAAVVQHEVGIGARGAWCSTHWSTVAAWTNTVPNLPICGPGPAYGGTSAYVDLPGPGGTFPRYFNATPGFQCVELAERWLALRDGLAPVKAEGDTVAANYHAAYPHSLLVRDGSPAAVGHAPAPGDVVSFSLAPGFVDPTDGHVAVVVATRVDRKGNGTVVIDQENVASGDYKMTLELAHWRLFDPAEPGNAALQYPYAEWFHFLGPALGTVEVSPSAMRRAVVTAARLLRNERPHAVASRLTRGVPRT